MNQDQVKGMLLQLDSDVDDFKVTFSGKASKKAHGLYYPDRKEIIIHNKNFSDDNSLMYTAIHEFAHHIHFTRSAKPVTSRSHTIQFWKIFHHLLDKAEEQKLYISIFKTEPRFVEMTSLIKSKFLNENGKLMKEFGALLIEAYTLCSEHNASWEDYVDRILGLHRTAAKTIMKMNSLNINPDIGYENMKTVAGIKEPEQRNMAEQAFLQGQSPDMVKGNFLSRDPLPEKADPVTALMFEKQRLEKSLESITVKLQKIEQKLRELESVENNK